MVIFLAGLISFAWAQSNTNTAPQTPATPRFTPSTANTLATNTIVAPNLNFNLPPKPKIAPLRPNKFFYSFHNSYDSSNKRLIDACDRGDLDRVKVLLNEGYGLDEGAGIYGVTPLMSASKHEDVTKFLLSQGAKVDLTDNRGNTALRDACYYNQLETVEALLEAGANPNVANNEGRFPLMDAAINGNDALVQALLAHHADVNGNNDAGPATWRAAENGHASTLTLLINSGADLLLRPNPVLPGRRFWSFMGCAADDKRLDIIDLLLAHGISVDDKGADGTTALMLATEHGQNLAVKRLLERGASVDLQNEKGVTALMFAAHYAEPPALQLLLDHHANLELKDHNGVTALIWSCLRDEPTSLRFLLDHGANVNAVDAQGDAALTYAGDRGLVDIMKLLKDRGARPVNLHIIAKEMPPQPLSATQRWDLAVSAIYDQINGHSPNFLGGGQNASTAKKMLSQDWGIHDDLGLLKELDDLQNPAHRQYYRTEGIRLTAMSDFTFYLFEFLLYKRSDKLAAIRENYAHWKDRTGLAWDQCRAAMLINSSFAAHYIDEREAWILLDPVARNVQNHFSSWHEMCDNFLDGREMWAAESDPDFDACGDLLCNSKDPNSPWNQIPWNMDLSAP